MIDSGKGFVSRQEIEDYFATFATPHEDGDSKFGSNRVGRGQAFSFAATKWRSGEFLMDVDVRERGLDFGFETMDDTFAGCRIDGELYEPLSPIDLQNVIEELKQLVEYAPIEVKLNGELISGAMASFKPDYEDDDFLIQWKANGGLRLYNIGVFVTQMHSYRHGVDGIVISKSQFKLNTARNAVLENQCGLWKRLLPMIKQRARETADREGRSNRLTLTGRRSLIREMLIGERSYSEVAEQKVIRYSNGKWVSIEDFRTKPNWLDRWAKPVVVRTRLTVAPKDNDRVADRLIQTQRHIVLSPWTLEAFGVRNVEGLLAVLSKHQVMSSGYERPFNELLQCVQSFEEAGKSVSLAAKMVSAQKCTDRERAMRSVAAAMTRNIAWAVQQASGITVPERRVVVGESDTAAAWTDGATYIAIERRVLHKAFAKGYSGVVKLANLMLHEYCHALPSIDSHGHDLEFFELFERVSVDYGEPIGAAFQAGMRKLIALGGANGKVKLSATVKGQAQRMMEPARLGDDAFDEALLDDLEDPGVVMANAA